MVITYHFPLLGLVLQNGEKELRVNNGEDIGISCIVEGDTDFTWALWTVDGIALTFNAELLASSKARYRLEQENIGNGVDFTLYIRNVQLKDEGSYACQVPEAKIDSVQLFVTSKRHSIFLETSSPGLLIKDACSDHSFLWTVDDIAIRPKYRDFTSLGVYQ